MKRKIFVGFILATLLLGALMVEARPSNYPYPAAKVIRTDYYQVNAYIKNETKAPVVLPSQQNHISGGTVTQTKRLTGIGGSYDPYDSYKPSRQLYRRSALANTRPEERGARFYTGTGYEQTCDPGALGTYCTTSKSYDFEERALRGTSSQTRVLKLR